MAKAKYSIIDADDNTIGFVVIEKPIFEHTQPNNYIPVSGPLADGALFLMVLGGIAGVAIVGGAPGWGAATVGIVITSTLAGIKAWRGTLALPQDDSPALLKGEFTASDGTIYLDEIKDKDIILSSLNRVCMAVAKNDYIWMGRPTMTIKARISQTQYTLIKNEFERLDYFTREGKTVKMIRRGQLFVKLVAKG